MKKLFVVSIFVVAALASSSSKAVAPFCFLVGCGGTPSIEERHEQIRNFFPNSSEFTSSKGATVQMPLHMLQGQYVILAGIVDREQLANILPSGFEPFPMADYYNTAGFVGLAERFQEYNGITPKDINEQALFLIALSRHIDDGSRSSSSVGPFSQVMMYAFVKGPKDCSVCTKEGMPNPYVFRQFTSSELASEVYRKVYGMDSQIAPLVASGLNEPVADNRNLSMESLKKLVIPGEFSWEWNSNDFVSRNAIQSGFFGENYLTEPSMNYTTGTALGIQYFPGIVVGDIYPEAFNPKTKDPSKQDRFDILGGYSQGLLTYLKFRPFVWSAMEHASEIWQDPAAYQSSEH